MEMLCVVVCAIWFWLVNTSVQESFDFTVGSPMVYLPHYTSYGWPAPCLATQTRDWLPPEEQVRYTVNWSGLMLNVTFTIAVALLGVLAIRLMRQRRFTLATGAVFVLYVCIAAGALNAALELSRWGLLSWFDFG